MVLDNAQDYVLERASAWAEIRESKKKETVLTAQAIGIEYFQLGTLREECLKLDYKGVYGYLPKSFIDNYDFKGIQSFIGKYFEFVVSYVDSEGEIFAANRIKALEVLGERFWKNGKVNQTIPAFVRGVDRFNAYLLVNGVPVVMHRNDFSHTFHDDLRQILFIGDVINVKVTSIQKPNPDYEIAGETPTEEEAQIIKGHVTVSAKALEVDPLTYISEYQEKSTYLGVIEKVHLEYGIFVRLLPRNIVALAGFPPGTNKELLREGQQVNFKIQYIDKEKRHVKGLIITPKQGAYNQAKGNRPYGSR
ncbi:30S ribosomal protein S1 [Peribacillus asahii]|uniref:30S ribosomal protein S1 n=1 Tax=Peribacillus asahii TaxID=228899 RepID=UPI002079ADDC|nr:30S ribosomal protein S1 [Peribacillus asahii]USK62311.1 30S ribosomal protein S1 [Peribacillus asahii]